MKGRNNTGFKRKSGFTLTELLVASSISMIVAAAALSSYIYVFKTWRNMDGKITADQDLNIAVSRMIYGVGDRLGLRAASSVQLSTSGGWQVSYVTGVSTRQTNSFTYSSANQTLVFNPGSRTIARGITSASAAYLTNSLSVTLRIDRTEGMLPVRREVGTRIYWRN